MTIFSFKCFLVFAYRERVERAWCPEAMRPRGPHLWDWNEKVGPQDSEHIFFFVF